MKVNNYVIRNLDILDYAISRAFKDRFILRLSKNKMIYLYDTDECGRDRLVKSKSELVDILQCGNLMEFTYPKDKNVMKNVLKEIGVI